MGGICSELKWFQDIMKLLKSRKSLFGMSCTSLTCLVDVVMSMLFHICVSSK